MKTTFRITTPHSKGTDWHQWYFPGAAINEAARILGPARRDRYWTFKVDRIEATTGTR